MVAMERKLGQLETALSGRDRALLSIQAFARGEEPDERLERYCPASERPTMVALKEAVANGIQQTWQRVLFEIEWLNNDELMLGWLECIAGFLEREKAFTKLAGANAKSVPAIPKPGRGFIRDLPLLWGETIDSPAAPPATWAVAVPFLVTELRKGVEIRWRQLLAYEEGFAKASQALGVEIRHPDLQTGMNAARAKLLDLHAALQQFERFDLTGPSERELEMVNSFWDWKALGEQDELTSARAGMHETRRADLEAWEREQAERLKDEG